MLRAAERQRQGQPELPERLRSRPSGPWAGQQRGVDRPGSRATRATSSPATTTTSAATARAAPTTRSTAATAGRTPRSPTASPRGPTGFAREYWQAGGDTSVGLGHARKRLPELPGVQPRHRLLAEPGPVERVRDLPLDPERRCVLELPRTLRKGVLRHHGDGWRARGQAADDRRRQRLAAPSATASTSRLRSSPPMGRPTSTRSTPTTTARRSAIRRLSARTARCARTRSEYPRRTGAATRTSSPIRSSDPTGTSTSSTATSTTSPPLVTRTTTRCCCRSRPTAAQTFSAPVKVSDYNDLPDCDTYQGAGADPGRACVPEKGSSNDLGVPRHQLRVGPGRSHKPQPRDRRVRLVHQQVLQREQRMRAERLRGRRQPDLHRREDARSVQQQDPVGRVEQRWVVVRKLDRSTRIRSAIRKRRHQRARSDRNRPVLAVERVHQARASWPSTTTTASTATTRPTARRTSACPGARTCRTSARSASRRARCRRRRSSRARTAASSTATT